MAHRPLHALLGFPPASLTVKVVDIGANPIDGEPPYAPLVNAGCAQVVGFEPNAVALLELVRKKGEARRTFRTQSETGVAGSCATARRLE